MTLASHPLESVIMNNRRDKIEQPGVNHFRLCQRLAELEGIAGQREIDPEKLPEEARHCTLAETINDVSH
jgi:hypothetical protein